MCSAGVITVSWRSRAPIEQATQAAAQKGSQLGCWILIEHSDIPSPTGRKQLDDGATLVLAHGTAGAIHDTSHHAKLRTALFDCMIRDCEPQQPLVEGGPRSGQALVVDTTGPHVHQPRARGRGERDESWPPG